MRRHEKIQKATHAKNRKIYKMLKYFYATVIVLYAIFSAYTGFRDTEFFLGLLACLMGVHRLVEMLFMKKY